MGAGLQSGIVGDLFWRVDDPVVLLRGERVEDWNPAAERRFGIPRQQAVGPRFELASLLGAAAPAFRALVAAAQGSARLDCAGGCGLVLEATVWRVGETDVVGCLLRDVTASVRLTSGLARLSSLGRELISGEPGISDLLQELCDAAKAVTAAAFSALVVVRPESSEVSHFAYNAPRERFPERLPRVVGLLDAALHAAGPVRLGDIRGAAGGVGIPVKHPPIGPLLAVPVRSGDALIGLVAVANEPGQREFDGTDETLLVDLGAHAGTALRWAQARELARLQRLRRQEVSAAARHDVRNPLAAGKGYARMLQTKSDRMTPEMIAEAYQNIERVFDRIESFTDRLLNSEDTELSSGTPRWALVDVDTLLERLASDLRAVAVAGELVVYRAEGTPSTFAADPEMVHDALENLVTNAVKYGDSRQPVTVTARVEGGRLRFDVHNYGEGIPPEEQGQIFDRYWRSERVRAGGPDGTGLGLAIVREIAEMHGGIAGVSSRPDEGTTFWITFPQTLPMPSAEVVGAQSAG